MDPQPPPKTKWIRILTAIPLPLLIILLLAAVLYFILPRSLPSIFGMQGDDFILIATLVIGGLSLPIGVIALVTLIIFRVKRRVTFSLPGIRATLLFACLDIALPVAVILLIMLSVLSRVSH